MNQNFSKTWIVLIILILALSAILVWEYWLKPEQEAKIAETVAPESKAPEKEKLEEVEALPEEKEVPEEKPEKTINPWDVFQEFLAALSTRDLDKANTLVYESININEWMNECMNVMGMSENDCWGIIDLNYEEGRKLKKSDFIIIEQDKNQVVMLTDLLPKEENGTSGYSQNHIYFVKDSKQNILLLGFGSESWYDIPKIELQDTDKDGLIDRSEKCEGALKYDPDCIKTNPNLKDTDGDGWWDSTELEAETDPNDASDYLTF